MFSVRSLRVRNGASLRKGAKPIFTRRYATPTIIYTETDEAPALATYSFLPILTRIAKPAGIKVP